MRFLSGRLNRAGYWWWLAVFVAAFVALDMLSSMLNSEPVAMAEGVLLFITVQRLRDIGMSGWWVAAPLVLQVVAVLVAVYLSPDSFEAVIDLIALVIIGYLIWLGALTGVVTALVFICAPRLHDIGRSGWWVAAPLALGYVGGLAAALLLPSETAKTVIGSIPPIIPLLFVWLGVMPGDPEANGFGDPPPPGLQFKPWAPAPE
jgi:uncharacterized membrane protein YhaH (DUF805 family)